MWNRARAALEEARAAEVARSAAEAGVVSALSRWLTELQRMAGRLREARARATIEMPMRVVEKVQDGKGPKGAPGDQFLNAEASSASTSGQWRPD